MQTFTPEFQAELDKGQTEPWVLVDGYEFYSADYIPGPDGFDPADAIECFAGQELTWNGVAYRREVISRGDIILNVGEKTNSVSITFSNISRYLATFAQSQTIEGMLLCIRCIAPSVTNDSKAMFHGRCDKPGDIDKKQFPLTARQDYGHLNQTAPPSKFTTDDPEGRLPSDPLFEGFPFFAVSGSYAFPYVRQSNGVLGRIFGRRTTDRRTEQWSSVVDTPYGTPIPEVFGRCQMELVPVAAVDKGIYIGGMWVACKGPIAAIENVKTRQAGISDPICTFTPTPAAIHLGDAGGTGTNLGNTCQADLGGGLKYSKTAYVDGAVVPTEYFTNPSLSDPNVLNELPPVTALILGRVVPLPDGSGDYIEEGWTDNPVHIARFILTDPSFVNIDPGFMEDAGLYRTALHCDEPLIDDSESQHIPIALTDINQAGVSFTRYRSTGLINPRSILYNDLGDTSIVPELVDGPYLPIGTDGGPGDVFCPIGQHRDPESGLCVDDLPTPVPTPNATQPLLRKRYTANFPITEEIRVVDLLYKIVFPSARLYMVVTGKGKLDIRSEMPASATRLRSATAVGATSLPVLDVTPWKSGPELLQGRIVISGGQIHSETRTVQSADYSTSGNSITLTASDTGGVTATASGANLSGGSTTVQASGTVTIGGTPGVGDTVTITIDGVGVAYVLSATDTAETTAAMLTAYINATKRLRQYIVAEWNGATVITIKCLHGALNVASAFLKVHDGPIANPTTAPTIAAAGSGSLQAGEYLVAYADQTALGLTTLTLIAAVTLTANQKINVSSLPAFPAGVTGRQFFVSDAPNSAKVRYLTTRADAANFSIDSLPLPGAANPPSFNSTSEELVRIAKSFATNSQDVFKPWSASTTLAIQGNLTDDTYLPTVPNGHKYQLTTAGTTGASEPTWPTGAGATVASGTAVFTEIGSTVLQQAGLTRANIVKDTFRWPLGGMQSSVNVIEIPFRDAKNDFALTTLRIHDPVHQAQVKKKFPLKIDGSAIDNFNQAYRVGNSELSKNREGDWFDALEGSPSNLVLEEGDLIAASDDSGGLVNVITRIEELRITPDHNVVITKARKYSTAMFSDDVGSHVIPIASTLRFIQTKDSLAEFIDSPPLRDEDALIPAFYVSVSHDLAIDGDWRGWELYADYGDGYKKIAEGDVAATQGECTTTLGAVTDPSVWDRTNSVTFTLDYAEASDTPFESVTEQDLLSNSRRNLFLIGNEYVQAATVVDNGNRSYTISTLLRARFGSEGSQLENLTHGASERAVFINGAETLVEINPTRLGGAFNYKVKTINQDLADVTPQSFTWTGGTVKPLAPVNLRGSRNATGDLLIEWDRRSRVGPGLTPRSGTALGEEDERYIVEVYSGSTLKRSIEVGGGAQDVIWQSTHPYAVITGNTFSDSIPIPNSAVILAWGSIAQQMSRNGGFYEHTIDNSVGTSFVTFRLPTQYPEYSIRVISSTLSISQSIKDVNGSVNTTTVASVSIVTGDRVRLAVENSELRFYKNYSAEGQAPLYVAPTVAEFPIRVDFAQTSPGLSGTSPKLTDAVMYTGSPGTIYSSGLQVEDFGSAQSSIKVRVMQISSLVGPGHYSEKTL